MQGVKRSKWPCVWSWKNLCFGMDSFGPLGKARLGVAVVGVESGVTEKNCALVRSTQQYATEVRTVMDAQIGNTSS